MSVLLSVLFTVLSTVVMVLLTSLEVAVVAGVVLVAFWLDVVVELVLVEEDFLVILIYR